MNSARIQASPLKIFKIKFLKYFEIAKINYFEATAYISGPIGLAFIMMIRIWMFFELYSTIFRNRADVNGFTLATTIWILAIVQVFQTSSRIRRQVKNFGEMILSGNIVYAISRPYNFMIFYISDNLGDMFGDVTVALPLVLAIAYFFVGPIKVYAGHILIGAVLMAFGILINLLITFILGLTAFWSESTAAARWIYDKLVWVFGGSVVPIAFFPDTLRKIVEFFPFTNIYYNPARLIIAFDAQLFIKTLLVQIFWIVILIAIGRKLFKKGLKELAVNGG